MYSHSGLSEGFLLQKAVNDDGVKINQYHNSAYRPIYLNSANSAKLVLGTEAIQTGGEKFVVASTSRFKAGLTSDGDVNVGLNKVNFSSSYLQNDTNNLNMYIADGRFL